jgi:glycosyltransferase involved in cell wall biosynthesis
MTMRVLQVDIVVPVRNEEHVLSPSIRRLVGYLRVSFPFTARVKIADNGSTDATPAIADGLAREFSEVRAVRLEQPGRGPGAARHLVGQRGRGSRVHGCRLVD